MKICVYCASSARIDRAFFDATIEMAADFAKNGVEVVYGGGAVGLMGQLADTILENGGKIKGIMPQFMNEVEWAHKDVTDFEFTQTMHERKARFLEGIDGVVALAGGTGTLEELLEAITLKRLGQFTKPIIILNTNGYYDPLKQMLERCIDEQFLEEKHLKMWTFVDTPLEVLEAIKTAPEWNQGAINFTAIKESDE
ncbi:MAG: TIGR00730 family Rossman fold protein [Flavobacteriales bacterium]|jgi:uncharacterized protein (TIGR00730 family)|nr:TIGR00730 family Rossman fold protein [Flavobacteriales bacterium]